MEGISIQPLQLDLITRNPDQPRKHFDEDALSDLANSFQVSGVIQPIVVRPKGEGFEIVAGERRHRAASLAGLTEIPAIVRPDLVGVDVTVIQILENLQRENLTLPELSAGVTRLVAKVGFKETCKQLGKGESWVSKRMGLLDGWKPAADLVLDGKIVDVELARELMKLHELAPDLAGMMVDQIGNPLPSTAPVTRESLRAMIDSAKQARENARAAQREQQEREAERSSPEAKAQAAADKRAEKKKQSKKEAALIKARASAAQFDADRQRMERAAQPLLARLLKLDKTANIWTPHDAAAVAVGAYQFRMQLDLPRIQFLVEQLERYHAKPAAAAKKTAKAPAKTPALSREKVDNSDNPWRTKPGTGLPVAAPKRAKGKR